MLGSCPDKYVIAPDVQGHGDAQVETALSPRPEDIWVRALTVVERGPVLAGKQRFPEEGPRGQPLTQGKNFHQGRAEGRSLQQGRG